MNPKQKAALIVIGLISIVIIGILASVVGNVGVRRIQPSTDIVFQFQEPVARGFPQEVAWTPGSGISDRLIEVTIRLNGVDQVLATSQLIDGSVLVVFPCSTTGTKGTLSMVDKGTGEVLTWRQIAILPAGPDCL